MKLSLAALLFLALLAPTPSQNRRIKKLEASLMAPCCYSQTIDEHMSSEAAQMRDEVTAMVLAGKSDDEILNFYEAKYGKTIRVVPHGTDGLFTFGIPIVVTVSTLAIGFAVAQKMRRRTAQTQAVLLASPQTAAPELIARIRRDLHDGL